MKQYKYFQLIVSVKGREDEYEVINATIYCHNFPKITIELSCQMFKLLKKLNVIQFSEVDEDGVLYYTSKIFTEV